MTTEVTLDNGDRYLIDPESRSIRPADLTVSPTMRDMLAAIATNAMDSGELVGPQVDEYVGLTGDWDAPRADLAAFFALADAVSVTGHRIVQSRPV